MTASRQTLINFHEPDVRGLSFPRGARIVKGHISRPNDPYIMKTQYIEEAAKVVPNKQQLINMVSKRLRELSAGSRPMVESDLQMGLADIALAEIAAGKLTSEASVELESTLAA